MSSIDYTYMEELHRLREETPEEMACRMRDAYPDITAEDAKRLQKGLLAVLAPRSYADLMKSGKEYTALLAELKKKYRKRDGTQ